MSGGLPDLGYLAVNKQTEEVSGGWRYGYRQHLSPKTARRRAHAWAVSQQND